jgi:hypothetical protein
MGWVRFNDGCGRQSGTSAMLLILCVRMMVCKPFVSVVECGVGNLQYHIYAME